MKPAKKVNKEMYFSELPKGTIALIKEMCIDTLDDNVEGFYRSSERVEDIECHSRDGFSVASHNKGGITVDNYNDLRGISGSGYFPAHKGACAEIERLVQCAYDDVAQATFEKFEPLLTAKKITKEQCTYGGIYDLLSEHPDLQPVHRFIEEAEDDFLGGENNTVRYDIQFMYHGIENGKHLASVSCAVNTEAPYHRRSISWAKGVFCEGAKEIEITWSNQKELKQKLTKALEKCAKEVF